jgi:hypothetical protein
MTCKSCVYGEQCEWVSDLNHHELGNNSHMPSFKNRMVLLSGSVHFHRMYLGYKPSGCNRNMRPYGLQSNCYHQHKFPLSIWF